MKIFGKKPTSNVETLILPRGDGSPDIVIKAQAVLDMTDFAAIVPLPTPPQVVLPGGERKNDVDDVDFKKKVSEWSLKRTHYMILKSLAATEGLEWETVDLQNPNTWGNYTTELTEAGFSDSESGKIIEAVLKANALSERHLDEARKRFLATTQVAAK